MNGNLDSEKIIQTVKMLHKRIEERFPASGLGRVCSDLLKVANENCARAEWIAPPISDCGQKLHLSLW